MSYAGRFDGRRAVVTGGASGIGLAVAQRLVAEGARVAIWDVNQAAIAGAEAALGGPSPDDPSSVGPSSVGGGFGLAVDATDWPAVERAAATTAERLGGLDVLVCSAGITGPNLPLADYPVDAWRRVLDVNVTGVFHCNRAAVPLMRRNDQGRGYGRIVNIASVAGKEGNPNASAYSTSKAAVIGMTKSLGKELVQANIAVNAIAPAAVRTPIFDQMTQQHIDGMLSKIPMGRFGRIDEIVALICWMASEECSFSTGAVFDASGGRATY